MCVCVSAWCVCVCGGLQGDTAFVQGGFDAFLRRDGLNLVGPMERMRPENWTMHGTDAYGWGGAGGSIIWWNPVEQIGFGYAITGFVGGFNGDQNRASSVLRGLQRTPAMGGADGAATMAAAMKGTAPPARL
eukprot:COSAG06_NODE_6384_length_2956_cov_5.115156_1_plen_132_part_00